MIGNVKQLTMAIGAAGAAGAALVIGVPTLHDNVPNFVREADDVAVYSICLKNDLPLFEGESKGCYGPADIARLKDLPVLDNSGEPVSYKLAHPTDHSDDLRTCTTCREYSEWSWDGWYAPTSREMRREAYFRRACGVIDVISGARAHETSYFGDDGLNATDVAAIPPAGLLTFSSGVNPPPPEYDVSSDGAGVWTLAQDGQTATLSEIAYADFDGDRIEDILVFISSGPDDGTAQVVDFGLLRRLGEDDSVTFVSKAIALPS